MELKLAPRDKIIAVGLLIVVVLVLGVFMVLRPQFSRMAAIRQEQRLEQEKVAQAKLKLERLDAIRQEAAEIEAKRILLSQRLPKEAELPTLVLELQKLSSAAGLDFTTVNFEQIGEQGGYAEVPFTITASGTFYSVVDFLYRVQKMTREVVIDSFGVTAGSYPQLSLSIKARAFKLSAGSAAPPPPPQGFGAATGDAGVKAAGQ